VKGRVEMVAAVVAAGVGLVIAAVLGLWGYMSLTATPVHPNPRDVPSVGRSTPSPMWAEAVEQAREAARVALSERNLPGLSVAVGAGDEIVWAEGFGWADLEKRSQVGPETRFRIGTASIALTSAAAGLLLEQQQLKLDEQIQTYVPEYPKKTWPMTLRQVMGHTAGLSADGGDESPYLRMHCDRPIEGLSVFAGHKPQYEPGTQYHFSTYGWILVSAAIESAAHESLLSVMRTRVFEPLGMRDTEADSATEVLRNRATPYFPRFAADPRYGLDLIGDTDFSCYSGAGVFVSTPSDLVRFAMAIDSGKLLQPATVRLLQTSQRLRSGQETGYGLGWDLETASLAGQQAHVIGHDGDSIGGMLASLMTFPEHGLVVAVTSNTSYADTYNLGLKIAQAFVEHGTSPARK
jgi:serine beta-lactamase-like protein LACTB, mitochondrial